MVRLRIWLALRLIRLARWVVPSSHEVGLLVNKQVTRILADIAIRGL